MGERDWKFEGTLWEFIHMVRHACVVYEYVREKKTGVIDILTDEDAFRKAADEYGITYEAVKAEIRRNLDFADHLDELMEENKSQKMILMIWDS
ncbi:MAG: hypothetical protein IJ719_16915 [Clostridia bacterium]|nr:hypothetical protein [Clostridia bacterium]